jgi:hypothetical protein
MRLTQLLLISITLLGMLNAAAADFKADAPTVMITGANRGLGLEFARQ